jgi:outer membrane protein, heavy metal efflux system
MFRRNRKNGLFCTLLVLGACSAWAQPSPPNPPPGLPAPTPALASPSSPGLTAPLTLKQAFDAAWLRQPEAQAREARQQAASARKQAADSWTPEPAALQLSLKSDRLNQNQGSREIETGVAIPLWLPGERSRTGALADAEGRATTSRVHAAQLRTAASVREAYWLWQRARIEHDLARERLSNAQALAADVTKRVRAGDLARADQHQADGAVASAEAAVAEAASTLAGASHQLRILTGTPPAPNALAAPDAGAAGATAEPVPAIPPDFASLDVRHPAVADLLARADVARRSTELAGVQTRSNPELTLATTRARDLYGEPSRQSLTLGIRIPFGSDSRNRTKLASAQAEGIEAEVQLALERERLLSELDAARIRLESARIQVSAADKSLQLARESRGFFQKSFRMGETDLPTRSRIELEAIASERQAARARIDLAAAVSTLRQALGLLPE